LKGHGFSRAEFEARFLAALQAAEKGWLSGEMPEKHTSGAKQAAEKLILPITAVRFNLVL